MTYHTARKDLVKWVRKQLIGPPDGREDGPDLHNVLPTERFPCGALYPTSQWGEGIDPAIEETEEIKSTVEIGSEKVAEPVITRRYVPPSSLGLSFFIKGDDIQFQVLCRATSYQSTERDEKGRYKNGWTHKELVSGYGNEEDFVNITCPGKAHRQTYDKLEGRARIDVLWRPFADGWIVTVSLCNAQEITGGQTGRGYVIERAEKTLFEASLRCVIDAGEVGVYPRVDRSLLDEEEQEIELQYAHRHIYAVGHGCAADWEVQDGKVIELRSETMPAVEVPQMTADTGSDDEQILSLARLADFDTAQVTLLPELAGFVQGYADWVDDEQGRISRLPADDQATARRMVERMQTAVARMRDGLDLLAHDARARQAFALANRAMLNQMRQHHRLQDKKQGDEGYRWRPFQLAFLLTTLESTANEDSEFRDMVDLIWFPTGGGKTEAYLGLIAFLIMLRRLRHPDTGGGTAVLMRYTLRLLTRDQFTRATRLICALELIRRERADLGSAPITIGLWVGDATSPNTFKKAAECLIKARASGDKPELVIDNCPWCGKAFTTERNYHATTKQFRFLCRDPDCSFGASPDGALPCNVVDEALYAEAPTMLVATVDKFARLAWDERANAFFGGSKHRPPEVIIQDELHLIASALGSVAGLYEAAIDTVLRLRGVYPKYIASTATIRMATQQVKRLYGRELAVFPPPGLSCDDSYFARSVPLSDERPGRMYVGYLAPLLSRQQCLAPLAATLLLAPYALFQEQEDSQELLDAWWTQVIYHGSLRGVGNSHTAFASDVRDFMRLLTRTTDGMPMENDKEEKHDRSTLVIEQLTSRQTAAENAEVFARLKKTREEQGCLDAVLATNMISVGLDVARLALMIINGQPLTTAEYIQASSRVGRASVPGVVYANYYRDQARSLSHYESFRPYHEAFYRFVEPTSITPYTYQTRMRAFHAALVIVMRHGGGLLENAEAGNFDTNNPRVSKAIEQLKKRCSQSAPDQADEVNQYIDALAAEWESEVKHCRESRRRLDYQVPDRDKSRDRLLFNHDDDICGLWTTLQSMRHVENTALLKVL